MARLAVGAQRQIHAKDLTVLGGLADQGIQLLDHFVKVAVVAHHATSVVDALRLPVLIKHIDQVDVTGHIQFPRAQFAHAHHPQLVPCALSRHGRAMALINPCQGFFQSLVQAELSQRRHALGDGVQGCLLLAVQHNQSLQHQLTQDAQRVCNLRIGLAQQRIGGVQMCRRGLASGQPCQFLGVAPVQALHQARALR